MKVEELIGYLQGLEQDKEVSIFWDGAVRGDVEGIVDDAEEVVLVGNWSIYRDGDMYGQGGYRKYEEEKIIYG
jgi:hypothetical protein